MVFDLFLHVALAIIFLFVLWKNLKEDYLSPAIFSHGFLTIFGIITAYFISHFFLPIWWFWLAALSTVLVSAYSVLVLKFKANEVVDATIAGLYPWIIIIFLIDSVRVKSVYSLGGFFVILAIYLLYHFLNSQYKKFTWYSGKVGFSGLSTIALFFLFRAISSLFFVDMLSFVGKSEVFLSAGAAFISFLGVFHLARKN